MAGLVELQIEYQRLVGQREQLAERFFAGEKSLEPQIRELTSRIAALAQQIDSLFALNSSGDIIRDDQLARTEYSNETSPPPDTQLILENGRIRLPPDTNTQSNALKFDNINGLDFGTDAPVRTLAGTQSIPNSTSRDDAVLTPQDRLGDKIIPGGNAPGAGAAGDDRGSAELISSLNAIGWDDKIEAQDNILSQYASYTYQASLYLIDRQNYLRILNTGSKDLSNAKLLIQSGGAAPAGRSDFFSLDYYIDRIELKSFFVGRGSRFANNLKEGRMTVIEPSGISFVQNLDAATQQYFGINTGNKRNFASQLYLLVIKFYGYDDQGNLVRGGRNSNQTTNQTSDPNAFVEKFYPLIITKLDFRIASKAVEYDIQFKAPPYYINASQGRGTLPFNFEFSGKTVKDILAGPDTYSANQTAVSRGSPAARNTVAEEPSFSVEYEVNEITGETSPILIPTNTTRSTRPPANASAVTPAKNTVRKGLMQRLNEYQQELVNSGVIQYADVFNIEFVLDSIGSATVLQPGLDKSSTSMATPGTAAEQKLPIKQSMDVNTQIQGFIAGTQIVQCIEQILRRSSYIRDQQTQIVLNKNGDTKPGPGVNLRNTAWYRIGFKAVPMLDKYDEKRNDYAYKITYTVSPYRISQLNSPYFKPPVFPGVHKSYKYWFTGENTEVLSYEESLNNLYFIPLTNTTSVGTSSVQGALAINEQLKFLPSTASGQSTQGGGTPRPMEPAANAADELYSPSDLKESNLTIVGDPAWLQQGEAFVALNKNNPDYFRAFLSDGTINFDAQQIMFEIAFNAPRDYNLATGLAQPTADRLNSTTQLDQVTKTPGPAQFSRIYIAKECTSVFERGKFIHHLKGTLMTYYPPGRGQGRLPPQDIPTAARQAAPAVSKAPTVTIGTKTFPVLVPALDPARRPLLNATPRPLPPNLQPTTPIPRTPLPLSGTAPPPGSVNPVTLLPNTNPPQRMVKDQ
jgi:hypothetical protein